MQQRGLNYEIKMVFYWSCAAFVVLTVLACTSTHKHDFEETTYEVQDGDCLWTIASSYCPKGMDMWDYIHKVYDANGLTTYTVYPGQVLTIYVQKESEL